MLISECFNRDEILSEVSKELKKYEIKIRSNEKHNKFHKNVEHKKSKKIFKNRLDQQLTENAIFSNGQCSVVPRFVLQACQRIQKESKTEGIFRKTGSVKKQQEIKCFLETNGSLTDKFNIIDIANLLKTYFRELPDPLLPQGIIQDSLIRCLIHCQTYEQKVEAILMTCLFLPNITVNTLAYFLQFLQVIIKNSQENFMTIDNLVKVLTPSIMPIPLNAPEKRLQSHFKVVELLIENANLIGVIPDRMIKRDDIIIPPMTEERKKKKRRSGSLNRVFNNFRRKIVGTLGSSESLDKSHENTLEDVTMATPNVTKSAKKRRLEKLDLSAFGSKKKNNALLKLAALPEIDYDNCSPYAPKKPINEHRKSLGEKPIKSVASPIVRRHSLAPNNTLTRSKKIAPLQENFDDSKNNVSIDLKEPDHVRDFKSEYEAFKIRVNSIEKKIAKEFNAVKLNAIKVELGRSDTSALDKVESKFHATLQEIEKIENPESKTEQLAKRLSRELKIRPHVDNAIIRSPSARKIGSLRRRRDSTSRERRLSRNQSWHLGPSALNPVKKDSSVENVAAVSTTLTSSLSFYPKPNLKRARLVSAMNHDAKALPVIPQSIEKIVPEKPVRKTVVQALSTETWTPATDFFNENNKIQQNNSDMVFKTPTRPVRNLVAVNEIDLNNTPMLPPKMTPIRSTPRNTPMSAKKAATNLPHTPSLSEREARASIIQIRNQNAGMVAQKAKLFDDLSADLTKSVDRSIKIPRAIINKNIENVKNMSMDIVQPKNVPSKLTVNSGKSPRANSRSPGVNRRMQLRLSTQSPVLKTITENTEKRINLLKPDVLNEIASPMNRKVLSQHNTPRRQSKTPSSSKKRRTPRHHGSKSPRQIMRRHHISFD